MNPYTTLNINKYSTRDEVRLAYRRMMKKHHPDTGDGDTNKLNEAKTAYLQLKNKEPEQELLINMIIPVTQAELVNMLGTTQTFDYEDMQFEVHIPYSVRMGDIISVTILADTKLKIKFKEHHEQQ